MPKQAKYPLIQYLKVENAYTQQVKAVLEQAAKNVEQQILQSIKSGKNPLTIMQLEAQSLAIKAHLRQEFNGPIKNIIAAGQKAAAADAVKVIGSYEKELLAALGNADFYDDIIAAEAARASAGINKLMARYTSSYKPLSERVYRAGVVGNGSIDKAINVALVTGQSAAQFAKSIRALIDPKVPGGVSYAAMRTARTEINNANHAASQQRYADSKIVEAVDWHLSTSHPEGDECDGLQADGPYPINEVPEKPHPQCLCYTTPALPSRKEFLERMLRGDYGDEAWDGFGFGEEPADSGGALDPTKLNWGVQNKVPRMAGLTSSESYAMRAYTGMSYGEINGALREGLGDMSKWTLNSADYWVSPSGIRISSDNMTHARVIDRLLRESKMPQALNFYRLNGSNSMLRQLGLEQAYIDSGSDLAATMAQAVGKRMDQHGFTSTSMLNEATQKTGGQWLDVFNGSKTATDKLDELAEKGYDVKFPWTNDGQKINLRITVPEGSPGMDITDYSKYGQDEAEVLFPPNMYWRIVGSSVDNKGHVWLDIIAEFGEPPIFPPGA